MISTRRTILLAGGGALAAAQTAPSDQIRMGVIGSGSASTFVITIFKESCGEDFKNGDVQQYKQIFKMRCHHFKQRPAEGIPQLQAALEIARALKRS